MSKRSEALAMRLEQGAAALAAFARGMSDEDWQTRVGRDGRKVGVIVHHVASMYPIEMQIARLAATGKPIEGVTHEVVAEINAKHAHEFDGVTRAEALALLAQNSAEAALGLREFTDEELDRAAGNSYSSDAPLTCQFWIEDHPVRHSFHHLARMKAAIKELSRAA